MSEDDKIIWSNIPIGPSAVVARVIVRFYKRTLWHRLICWVGLHQWEPWDDECPECAGVEYCARCGEMRHR